MSQRFGINIVFFGNLWNLFRSFALGSWNFKQISTVLTKSKYNFGIMLLPLRGMNNISYKEFPKSQVLTFEEAWNISEFWPAVKKLLNFRILNVLTQGSSTGKASSGFTFVDKVAGDNVSKGTIIDWLLFGPSFLVSAKVIKRISRFYPEALKSSHSLINSPIMEVREIHPEMEMEYKKIKHDLKLGKKVNFHPEVESELELILNSSNFVDYLTKSNLYYCLDIFHALQRGSRDGSITAPVVNSDNWINFLFLMKDKVKEVHFRLDKKEVELILSGKAKEVKAYNAMCYMYLTYNCDIIYELYPNLLMSVSDSLALLEDVHTNLLDSFGTTLKGINLNLSEEEVLKHFQVSRKPKKITLKKISRR